MFKDKIVDYRERRKIAEELKIDGYISMVQISGYDMHFETNVGLYKVRCTPKELQKFTEDSNQITGYKLYFGGKTYKYWYSINDLVNHPWVNLVRTY